MTDGAKIDHQRNVLYAEFCGRVDAIVESIQEAARAGDCANIIVDANRIESLRFQLRLDLDGMDSRQVTT